MNKNKIYLIKAVSDDKTFYKIGFTKGPVKKRVTELQTGCPFKIEVVDTFDTSFGQTLEKTLHNLYNHLKTHGEWFELGITEEINFKKVCEKYENIHNSLNKKEDM